MELNYYKSESTVKPPMVERGVTTAYFRQNIVEEDRDGITFYVYEEATMPVEEFDKYAAEIAAVNAVKGANDSENILNIQETSINNSDNQLILMEAIADLYDLLAEIIGG